MNTALAPNVLVGGFICEVPTPEVFPVEKLKSGSEYTLDFGNQRYKFLPVTAKETPFISFPFPNTFLGKS